MQESFLLEAESLYLFYNIFYDIVYCISFCFQAVELEYLKSDLIPMFINLAQDEQVLIIIIQHLHE